MKEVQLVDKMRGLRNGSEFIWRRLNVFARNALFIDSNTDELIRRSLPNEEYIVIVLDTLRLQTEIGELCHLLG